MGKVTIDAIVNMHGYWLGELNLHLHSAAPD